MYFVFIIFVDSECKTISKAFAKFARHLETIQLPMGKRVGERNVPSQLQVEAVLSALTKLPTLKDFTLNVNSVRCVVL